MLRKCRKCGREVTNYCPVCEHKPQNDDLERNMNAEIEFEVLGQQDSKEYKNFVADYNSKLNSTFFSYAFDIGDLTEAEKTIEQNILLMRLDGLSATTFHKLRLTLPINGTWSQVKNFALMFQYAFALVFDDIGRKEYCKLIWNSEKKKLDRYRMTTIGRKDAWFRIVSRGPTSQIVQVNCHEMTFNITRILRWIRFWKHIDVDFLNYYAQNVPAMNLRTPEAALDYLTYFNPEGEYLYRNKMYSTLVYPVSAFHVGIGTLNRTPEKIDKVRKITWCHKCEMPKLGKVCGCDGCIEKSSSILKYVLYVSPQLQMYHLFNKHMIVDDIFPYDVFEFDSFAEAYKVVSFLKAISGNEIYSKIAVASAFDNVPPELNMSYSATSFADVVKNGVGVSL